MKRMRVGLMAAPLGADKQSKGGYHQRGALSEHHSRVTMSRANEDTESLIEPGAGQPQTASDQFTPL